MEAAVMAMEAGARRLPVAMEAAVMASPEAVRDKAIRDQDVAAATGVATTRVELRCRRRQSNSNMVGSNCLRHSHRLRRSHLPAKLQPLDDIHRWS